MDWNKISSGIWTAVGILLGTLFLLGLLGIFVGAAVGIYKYKSHHVAGVAVEPGKNDKKESGLKVTVQYELPLPVEGSEYFIVPVKLEKKEDEDERDSFRGKMASEKNYGSYEGGVASGSYSYGWGPYYNFVFIHKTTGESQLLLSEKGFIHGVYFPDRKYGAKKTETKPTFLLFKIALADTNQDGLINEKDAMAGYVSGLDGTNLTQVTPSDTQMGGWHYDREAQTLFAEVFQDLNKDQKFNWDDPKTLVSVKVQTPQMGQELIPKDIKDKVESILK